MKMFAEFLPVVVFFIAYKQWGILPATGVLMGAMSIQMGIQYFRGQKPTKMQLISLLLVLVLGGVTIFLKDERFIKWKVTIVNWAFAVAFLGSHYIGKKTLIERMLGDQIKIGAAPLRKVNMSWVIFFVFVGALNLFVVYNFDTDFWVNFKLFGLLGMTLIFVMAQALYFSKAIKDPS